MSKKFKLGLTSALIAGSSVAAYQLAKKRQTNVTKKADANKAEAKRLAEYRNTERGLDGRNSKGIYYTSGNYEAFVTPEKPKGIEKKHAYLVGSGLASLAAACFLVRDAQMPGENIHILEAMDIAGGACDGILDSAVILCVVDVKWKITLNVYGIYLEVFHRLKNQDYLYWMNIIA